MKYIKYTLWIMLAFLLLFLTTEVMKHFAQQRALIKAIELQTYGPQGKPKEINLDEIKISGTIYPKTKYKIGIIYSAQRDSRLCKTWTLFGGTVNASKSDWYEPIIENGQHQITLPLDRYSQFFGCKYKLTNIILSLDRGEYQLPSGSFLLFYPGMDQVLNPPGYGFKRQEVQGDKSIINIECILPDPNNINFSYSPCGQAPIRNKLAVSQYLKPNISEYEININFLTQEGYKQTLDNDSQHE